MSLTLLGDGDRVMTGGRGGRARGTVVGGIEDDFGTMRDDGSTTMLGWGTRLSGMDGRMRDEVGLSHLGST